jgi:hypothetical protein
MEKSPSALDPVVFTYLAKPVTITGCNQKNEHGPAEIQKISTAPVISIGVNRFYLNSIMSFLFGNY